MPNWVGALNSMRLQKLDDGNQWLATEDGQAWITTATQRASWVKKFKDDDKTWPTDFLAVNGGAKRGHVAA